MKHIIIDDDLCRRAKQCVPIANEAVELTDDGIAHANDAVLTDETAAKIEAACPSMAILLTHA